MQVNLSTLPVNPTGMIQATVVAQSHSNFICKLWMMRGTLLILSLGSKVKVKLGPLSTKPCGHNTDYRFCLITFKLHL